MIHDSNPNSITMVGHVIYMEEHYEFSSPGDRFGVKKIQIKATSPII